MHENLAPRPFENYQPPALEDILAPNIHELIETDLLLRQLRLERINMLVQCGQEHSDFLNSVTDMIASHFLESKASGFDKSRFIAGEPYNTTIPSCSSEIDPAEYSTETLEMILWMAAAKGLRQGLGSEMNEIAMGLRSVYDCERDEVNITAWRRIEG